MVTRVGPPATEFPGSMAVAVAEPYDIAYLRDTSTYLATYPDNPVSMESVARVIVGGVAPTGKLPVDIPAADGSGAVLYPLGHGETY